MPDELSDAEILRRAAQILGRRKSDRKAASSAANAERARAARKPPLPCDCNQTPHKSTCPVSKREAEAARYAARKSRS